MFLPVATVIIFPAFAHTASQLISVGKFSRIDINKSEKKAYVLVYLKKRMNIKQIIIIYIKMKECFFKSEY